MSRIFLSHSSADNTHAIALRDWMVGEGWNDLFLDLDPERGIAAGERWERALQEAARRCEAVLFLISKAWLASRWCMNELTLARRLNKRLFGVLIEEGQSVGDLPSDVTSTWQLVNLATGRDHKQFRVTLPITGEEVHVTLSLEGLARLKSGLRRAGLHASYFNWPPENDPDRPPYRGLKPLEADDAGIFFGREAPIIEAIDRLRGLREAAPERLLVIIGASGAGKSSFLRAGLLPRLARDDTNFLPLPVIRPERAAITGETGLLNSVVRAFESAKVRTPRAELRAAIEGGAAKLKPYLNQLAEKASPIALDGEARHKPPAVVLAIDQGEELFLAEAEAEARPFLVLLRELVATDGPAMIVIVTIRSDNYERLQEAEELDGVHQDMLNLPPMPKGSYAEVIKGPVRRREGTARALKVDEALVDTVLADIEVGGAKDALPLLAFTLERLYGEYHAGGHLKVEHYEQLGRVKGSIEAAVDQAFKAADDDTRIPRDRQARLALLRRGLIPWLAGIDPETGAPRRRVARLSEIPVEARPLIDQLVAQRLLSTDVAKDSGETTIEPAHEALLRQWGQFEGWLKEDAGLLTILGGVKRAARDWAANGKVPSWLAHGAERLRAAERLLGRPDLAAHLEPTDREYVAECRKAEEAIRARARRAKVLVGALTLLLAGAGATWWQEKWLREQYRWHMVMGPAVLTAGQERALQPKFEFKECANGCPAMIVVPAGKFKMGSVIEALSQPSERPQHEVTIAKPFAVGKTEVTFAEWDICVAVGPCPKVWDKDWGRDDRPVINVSWEEAKGYIAWLKRLTGKEYRLLSEAEWEYAAKAGGQGIDSLADLDLHGDDLDERAWWWKNSKLRTHPVGRKKANAFGLYDMYGNVTEWVEDRWHRNYIGAPSDGSAWIEGGDASSPRIARGGSWSDSGEGQRLEGRWGFQTGDRSMTRGFRVARTLQSQAPVNLDGRKILPAPHLDYPDGDKGEPEKR